MTEELNNLEGLEREDREDVYSKVVRAGKRTYFFDVKATRRNEFYLTITESKKRMGREGKFFFEKHKIFLYKEDFEKFSEGLSEVVEFIKENQGIESTNHNPINEEEAVTVQNEFTNISFDDLDGK
ncbi:MAG TPA: DUF3276 family protein [Tenuifilaceae bacterium]|nr:DUF3276 family protein [Tenuifilaceae bacterium]HPE18801.1 DUF3276 family protein [Tenuifilaceae bacterium]HPJ46000.1 DUF3276 family protein [Tenuifilaceae bacterium]HPQ34380.1 DUF3276 family protein [Tenuifilaceae bacterium]HRX68540.1 DUF3276 family protein [Tenuifilaceae bacterium]